MQQQLLLVLVLAILLGCTAKSVPSSRPVWPTQFDVPFGLSVEPNIATFPTPAIVNATSHFYYNYDINATLITYTESCLPGLLPIKTNFACNLLFNTAGTYIIAPSAGVDCCLLFPGIGVVPPDFLAPFNATPYVFPAADFYGVLHPVNFWTADPFYYWTDVNSGLDIQFVDGGVVMWNFSPNPTARDQPASLFQVPKGCASSCPSSALKNPHLGFGLVRRWMKM